MYKILAVLLLWPALAWGQYPGALWSNQYVGVAPRSDAQFMFTNPAGGSHAFIVGYLSQKPGCQMVTDCNHEVSTTGYGWDYTGNYLLQIGSFRMQWAVPPTYPSGYGTLGMCVGKVYGNETCLINAFGDETVTIGGNSTAPFQKPASGTRVTLWVNGTAPSGPNADGPMTWAENGHLKVMNSAGHITDLSP